MKNLVPIPPGKKTFRYKVRIKIPQTTGKVRNYHHNNILARFTDTLTKQLKSQKRIFWGEGISEGYDNINGSYLESTICALTNKSTIADEKIIWIKEE